MNAWEFWKEVKLKWGDIKSRVKGDLIPRVWKDKLNINVLMNMHEGNFCDELNTLKPGKDNTMTWIGYVDKSDHMTNTPLVEVNLEMDGKPILPSSGSF
jgi:hypothetical protein